MKSLIYFFIFLPFVFNTMLPSSAEETKSVKKTSKLQRNTDSISVSLGTVFPFNPILGVNYLRLDFDLNEKFTVGTSYGIGSGDSYSYPGFSGHDYYYLKGGVQTVSVHGKYYFFGAEVNNFFTETTVTGCFNFDTPFNGNIIYDDWQRIPISDFDRAYGAIIQVLGYEFSGNYFKFVVKAGLAGIGSKSASGSHPFGVQIGTIYDISLGFIF